MHRLLQWLKHLSPKNRLADRPPLEPAKSEGCRRRGRAALTRTPPAPRRLAPPPGRARLVEELVAWLEGERAAAADTFAKKGTSPTETVDEELGKQTIKLERDPQDPKRRRATINVKRETRKTEMNRLAFASFAPMLYSIKTPYPLEFMLHAYGEEFATDELLFSEHEESYTRFAPLLSSRS